MAEEPAPARSSAVVDLVRLDVGPFACGAAPPSAGARDPSDRHRDDEAERQATEHHHPQRVAPAVGDERRRHDDRVHDRRGEHERDGGARARGPSRRGAEPPAPSRTRRRGTRPRPPPRPAAAGPGRSTAIRANAEAGTSTSIAADTVAPSRMNGIASTSSDPNTMRRLRSHGMLDGSTTRTSTAIATSVASTQTTGARAVAAGRGSGAVPGSSRRPSAVPREGHGERRVDVGEERGAAGAARSPAGVGHVLGGERPLDQYARSRNSPSAAVRRRRRARDRRVDVRRQVRSRRRPGCGGPRRCRRSRTSRRARTASHRRDHIGRAPVDLAHPTVEHDAQHVGGRRRRRSRRVTMARQAARGAPRSGERRATSSRSSLSRYQPSPMMPRSAGSVRTAATSARRPLACVEVVGERRDHRARARVRPGAANRRRRRRGRACR